MTTADFPTENKPRQNATNLIQNRWHSLTNELKRKIMEELKLHSFGQNDHIESLKKKYNSLKEKI
ncbi:hypothetical protein, partial [Olleya sediminilitoris]|uniref:hypothetical protein n=1 Tax=Olleya sediminilitoris TaxID=2795739 RepID=UPI001C0663F5